jgi:hypothetical protein
MDRNMKKQLIDFAEKHSFKKEALAAIDKVLDAHIESDKKVGIDFLCGHDKSELIYEFGRYEFQIDKDENCLIAVRINIYSKKLYGPNTDVPVGYYIELKDTTTGEHIDEFLGFDWSLIDFNIEYHIERVNSIVPQRYFKRNIPEYEFVTYVNHIISLFQGRQFEGVIVFVKRCLDYLENTEKKEIQKEYLNECLELFKGIFHFIQKNELVKEEKLIEYRIKERIKTKVKK